MPATDPASRPLPVVYPALPRNERKRRLLLSEGRSWAWPMLGLLAGAAAALAVRLPLAILPLAGTVTFPEINAAQAAAVLGCAALAGICCGLRWFRPALWANGILGGLLLASFLERFHDYQAMRESRWPLPGAEETAWPSAAVAVRMLAAIRPQTGGILLLGGCLVGTLAAFAGGGYLRRRELARERRLRELPERREIT